MEHRHRRLLTAVLAALTAVVVSSSAVLAQVPPGGLPARVTLQDVPVSQGNWRSVDFGATSAPTDDRYARTTWRVVERTGNCCENYVTVNQRGQLFDFGGTYIYFSNDRGVSWRRVEALTPLVNGEGAIVVAPGGDILGVGWDPYSGDHLQSYKYEATTEQWLYAEMPLHQPFYDREWISVVPGPINLDGKTYEYVSFIKGATPWKELWFYSTDGINYTDITSKAAEQIISGAARQGRLPTAGAPINDWAQANTNGGMTSLGGGKLLAQGDLLTAWSFFNGADFSWSEYHYRADNPDTEADETLDPQGRFQVDSAGRIHNVVPSTNGNFFMYRISSDGGTTWRSTAIALPKYHSIEEWDFRANRAAGVAAVAIHAADRLDGKDQDIAFKIDIRTGVPRAIRYYTLGRGDINSTGGVGNDIRMDFQTIGIFPDGRLVLSFLDSTTTRPARDGGEVNAPALAIEQTTLLGGLVPPPVKVVPTLGTPYASFTFEQGEQGWTSSGTGRWLRQGPGARSDGTDAPAQFGWAVPAQLYFNMMDASVTSPQIRTQAGKAVVQFMIKYDVEPGFDYVYAEWTANGNDWLPLADFTGRNAGYPKWEKVTVGFDAPSGNIQVRFRMQADQLCSGLETVWCGVPFQGVRVDQVVVGKQATN